MSLTAPVTGQDTLRFVLFLEYEDGRGKRFVNSPGLLPLVGRVAQLGFDVDFVSRADDLRARVAAGEVDVVGVSSMERLLPRSIPLARELRSSCPGLILMLGGNSIDPFAPSLAAGLFDIVVTGEAEHSLPAVLDALCRARGLRSPLPRTAEGWRVDSTVRRVRDAAPGGALTPDDIAELERASFLRALPTGESVRVGIGGVFLRDPATASVVHLEAPTSPPRPEVRFTRRRPGDAVGELRPEWLSTAPLGSELDSLCVVPWPIVEREGWRHFEFYTQRGCRWGHCTFCSVTDRRIRSLSPERCADIIDEALGHGVEVVSFSDDVFVQKRSWNAELLRLLAARGCHARYRAQTIPDSTFWPLLDSMREIGFVELAFGVETVLPERAVAMKKSFDGERYVRDVRESLTRTAAAGIDPVLYLIMADPSSTLPQIATELRLLIALLSDIYQATGVLPRASYSLAMLPVASTPVTGQYPFLRERIELEGGDISVPTEFEVEPAVRTYLRTIHARTAHLPRRRENLAAMEVYLDTAAEQAEELAPADRDMVRDEAQAAHHALCELFALLDADIQRSADELADVVANGAGSVPYRLDFRRFASYVPGVVRYHDAIAELGKAPPLESNVC